MLYKMSKKTFQISFRHKTSKKHLLDISYNINVIWDYDLSFRTIFSSFAYFQDKISINFRYRNTDTSIMATTLTTLTIAGRSIASSFLNAVMDTFLRVPSNLFVYRMPGGPLYLPVNVCFFLFKSSTMSLMSIFINNNFNFQVSIQLTLHFFLLLKIR